MMKKINNKSVSDSLQTYVSEHLSVSPGQRKFKKLMAGLIILAVLLLVGWSLHSRGVFSQLAATSFKLWQELSPSQPAAPQTHRSPTRQAPLPTARATITGKGFVPQTLLVKKGSQVSWTNQDKKSHQVTSDPHPTHSLLPALGQGKPIPPNSTFTFTFDKAGTFTYHDELNPLKFKGVVIVK